MTRYALIVGVGEYSSALPSLPEAQRDVQAMQQVLEQRGFDQVRSLVDPQLQELNESIEELLANRQDSDTLLFYFSGHGLKDSSGEFYLTTRATEKDCVKQTSVSSSLLTKAMNTNQANQILILDCCYSDSATRDAAHSEDLSPRLISENRAILTSSIPWQSFSNRQESELSVYTHYLVQGLKTGLADSDHDGLISVGDLYRYVKRKLRERGLEQEPELLASGKAREIYLTTARRRELKSLRSSQNIAVRKKPEQEEIANLNQLTDIQLLLQALKSQSSNIRQRAAEILGNLQSEDAVLVLAQLLSEDENLDVRSAAAEALGKIYEKQGA